jgi:alkyl sulfatase BDS1-like metallo-beta-lactamase superfamily hydrolase
MSDANQKIDNRAVSVDPKEAESFVKAGHKASLDELPFSDRGDFADADRGFVATIPNALIKDMTGNTVWDLSGYDFLQTQRLPDVVHPSLWRLAQLNCKHGLFQVCERIYQIRGFDIANMTIVEGVTGIIVIDTLSSAEPARAGIELYFKHRGNRPIVAVIYTHTHLDHWGGVGGIIGEEDAATGVQVIAPDRFLDFAVSENIIAGNAMARRAQYQFGLRLPKGPRGQVDAGLGKNVSRGTVTLFPPNDVVCTTGERRVVDGVEIVFQMAPNSEAPAEFHLYFPGFRALNMAENATHLLHNLLPFRGAEVRDALAWSKYLNEAIELFADKTDVLMAQHHWPVWGTDRIRNYLTKQRDLYKYIHDQTLRLINHGFTATEIAEQLKLPASLSKEWFNRDYYGTVRHNAKAIYQKYLGWYDSNPANLDPLPPIQSAKKYVEYMGGAEAIIQMARKDFRQGHYRWVAEVMNRVVFAEPENIDARMLAADALEQLGYNSEAATWRNSYLCAAFELRNGLPQTDSLLSPGLKVLHALTIDMVFDFFGVRLNGLKAEGKKISINWNFSDTRQQYVLNLENCALTYTPNKQALNADATLTMARAIFDSILMRKKTFPEAIQEGLVKIDGQGIKLLELFGLFENFDPMFEIVTPKRVPAGN